MSKTNTNIGFIGTGVMGKSMIRNLLKGGYQVTVYNRTAGKAQDLIADGASLADSVAGLATKANVIITMVGYPKDVEEIYLGQSGILENAAPGTYLVDMTTSSPALAKRIYQKALESGQYSLDAPVSGGDVGAKSGTLTIMVGGDPEQFEVIKPILECMGSNIILQGGPGAGQHTKMANQIAIASNMIGVCETIAYAVKAGLDPQRALQSVGSGAAASWSLNNLGQRMIVDDFAPGFYVKHFIKDMTIALEEAQNMGLMTPGLELSKSLYEKLAAVGEQDSGTQALYKLFINK